ncbi:MAG: phage portal protein [Armatimonadia bacterium]
MNFLDRAIAALSPSWGLERLRFRSALGLLETRGYDGGQISRRLPRTAPATSANAELGQVSIERLRARARDLVRNNPYCSRALEIWTSNVVGGGIVPAPRTGDRMLNAKVRDLWSRFCEECDSDNQMDFYGLQSLAVRSAFEGGDTLARLRTRRAGDGLAVPLQIQLMEGDQLDASRHGMIDGGRSVLGVQFDAIGRRTGYWLFPEHPGDQGQFRLGGLQSQRIPSEDVIHLYRKARIGQVRGVSAFAPVMLPATDLRDLQEAVIVKSRIEACFAGFIVSDEADGGAVGPQTSDADGNLVQELQPGMVRRLKPGESIEFANPTPSVAYDPVMLHTLMSIAVGLGLTYDQLTGDLRQANYSSLRAGKIEMRRIIEQVQYQMVIPLFCRPVWRRFIEIAILSGQLSGAPDKYRCEWIAPAHEAIDPEKDLRADIMAVRSGRMTLTQFIAAWGNDPDNHLAQIKEANDLLDSLGLKLDTDPRNVSAAGQLQAGSTSGADVAAPDPAAA